jgi:hypothetical protein
VTGRPASRAQHLADVDTAGRPGPFILTACIGRDGSVWAALTDAAGRQVAATRPIPAEPDTDRT